MIQILRQPTTLFYDAEMDYDFYVFILQITIDTIPNYYIGVRYSTYLPDSIIVKAYNEPETEQIIKSNFNRSYKSKPRTIQDLTIYTIASFINEANRKSYSCQSHLITQPYSSLHEAMKDYMKLLLLTPKA